MRRVAILLALVSAACTEAAPARPSRAEVQRSISYAAQQVRRCYRAPRVSSEARQIVTRLRVRLTTDGQLAALPMVVSQNGGAPGLDRDSRLMAEAAIAAVIRCAPIALWPPLPQSELTFMLTFSPLAMG
ncbi:MAG: cell envelope integrity protein TolA [Sphingosinicella sp.]